MKPRDYATTSSDQDESATHFQLGSLSEELLNGEEDDQGAPKKEGAIKHIYEIHRFLDLLTKRL